MSEDHAEAFLKDLRDSTDLHEFVHMEVFECIPLLWDHDHDAYGRWRGRLARLLGVDPAGILVVGSAAIGVSLNPNKEFKRFDSESDVDVAVVDRHYFDLAWRHLRMMPAKQFFRQNQKTQEAIQQHRQRYIYWGTIATDFILQVFPFAREWLEALETVRYEAPVSGRVVNIRLYRDHDSLRSYQLMGMKGARSRLTMTLSSKAG